MTHLFLKPYNRFRAGWFPFLGFFLLLTLVSGSLMKLSGFCEKNFDSESMKKTINTLPIRSAQNNKLCLGPVSCETIAEAIVFRILKDSSVSVMLKSFIELQFAHGLRVSEVLGIRSNDLLSSHRIRIRSGKGSLKRVICHNDSTNYLDSCRLVGKSPFFDYSRFFVYRAYKKLGIDFSFGNGKHRSVTHAPRHFAALEIHQALKNKKIVSDFLRHKSVNSVESYI